MIKEERILLAASQLPHFQTNFIHPEKERVGNLKKLI